MSVVQVKERPILFNGEMVRAILDGRKTVTRRLVPAWQLPSKTYDDERWISVAQRHPRWGFGVFGETEEECMANYSPEYRTCCPFGAPGERLWVRESWWQAGDWQATYPEDDAGAWFGSNRVIYSADGTPPNEPNRHYPNALRNGSYSAAEPNKIWRHRPSIHMPRWACRILLEVTSVRVERLQDISEEQAWAEGIIDGGCTNCGNHEPCGCDCPSPDAVDSFVHLWKSTCGDWDANPWVWVVEFKRIES